MRYESAGAARDNGQSRSRRAGIGEIAHGALILVCAMQGDDAAAPARMAAKLAKLRIFRDDDGRMNKSLRDVNGAALIVSQFTLAADTTRGNRPGFSAAASPEVGKTLYAQFVAEVSKLGIPTATGEFGADMSVSLTNDGPVTVWVEV